MTTSAAQEFDTSDAHPAPPARPTPPYASRPPTAPYTVPMAEDCTSEQLLDLAAAAARDPDTLWSLLGSSAHVAAICRLLSERVEPALRAADKAVDELQIAHAHEIRTQQLQLAALQGIFAARTQHHENERRELIREICDARDAHQATVLTLEWEHDQRVAEMNEANRLRHKLADLSNDAAEARKLQLRFESACLAISRKTYLEVQTELEAEERAERVRLGRATTLATGSDDAIVIDVPLDGATP